MVKERALAELTNYQSASSAFVKQIPQVRNGEIVSDCNLCCQSLSRRFPIREQMEALAEYIRQMMRIKHLKGVDIQKRSGGKITDAYISDIINGKTKRVGVEKIQALADGLGVDSIEVFKVAVGYKEENVINWPGPILVKAMEKIVHSPELTQIVKKLLAVKPSKLKALLKQLEKE